MQAREPSMNLPTLDDLRHVLADGQGTLKPGSAIHAVMKHPLAFVAGEAQALVTVHHHGIMQVMAAHSALTSEPLQRVQRTRALMEAIKFGPAREAELASRRLWDIHAQLHVAQENGDIITSTDPELLAVLMIMGQRCSASWNTMMAGFTTRQELMARADELFARMWVDHEGSRASVGIPAGYLPSDPGAATSWVMATLDKRWTNEPTARALAAHVMALPQAYARAKFAAPWATLLRIPASAIAHAAAAAAVLSLRHGAQAHAADVATSTTVMAGLAAARIIRIALATLPQSLVARLVGAPPVLA